MSTTIKSLNSFGSQFNIQLPKRKDIDSAELKDLIKSYQETKDETILDTIVTNNLPLVRQIVGKIARSYNVNDDFKIDLFQEGCIGLINAINKFDTTVDNTFSTFAYMQIMQPILKYLRNCNNLIRIPEYVIDVLNKVNKYKASNNITDLSHKDISKISMSMSLKATTIRNVIDNTECNINLISSLDAPLNTDDGDITLSDVIESKSDNDLFRIIDSERKRNKFMTMFKDILNTKEYFIICKRYGFNEDNESMTLEAIGGLMDLTKERVRQIESNAIKKLKKYIQIKKIDLDSF